MTLVPRSRRGLLFGPISLLGPMERLLNGRPILRIFNLRRSLLVVRPLNGRSILPLNRLLWCMLILTCLEGLRAGPTSVTQALAPVLFLHRSPPFLSNLFKNPLLSPRWRFQLLLSRLRLPLNLLSKITLILPLSLILLLLLQMFLMPSLIICRLRLMD